MPLAESPADVALVLLPSLTSKGSVLKRVKLNGSLCHSERISALRWSHCPRSDRCIWNCLLRYYAKKGRLY